MAEDVTLPIANEGDIVLARQRGRELAAGLGFSLSEQALIATAISEVARNIIQYARQGSLSLGLVSSGDREGISVVASDRGPGIADVALAMQDGYSTGGGLGLGLPGARRMVDDFEIVSELGRGTTITMRRWAPRHGR